MSDDDQRRCASAIWRGFTIGLLDRNVYCPAGIDIENCGERLLTDGTAATEEIYRECEQYHPAVVGVIAHPQMKCNESVEELRRIGLDCSQALDALVTEGKCTTDDSNVCD